MGNVISINEYIEYKNKIDALEQRVLELEQKVFLGYENVNGRLVKESENTNFLPTPIPKKENHN
tara:strand:+ start:157 stop:348 length:192 start_codon:yes stop_codon:yes gene_type:complete